MKLNDFLENLFKNLDINLSTSFDEPITGDALERILPFLKECDEFKNVTTLEVLRTPHVLDDSGETIKSETFLWRDGAEFRKRCYIYGIFQTPEIFDPSKIHETVKDGAYVTPPCLDTKSFKSKRHICLEFHPEELQDNPGGKKKELTELLCKVIDSIDEYFIKGEKKFMIRGIFEEVKSAESIVEKKFGNLKQ